MDKLKAKYRDTECRLFKLQVVDWVNTDGVGLDSSISMYDEEEEREITLRKDRSVEPIYFNKTLEVVDWGTDHQRMNAPLYLPNGVLDLTY